MVITAASAAYLNLAVEPTPNSLRSYLAPAIGRGSPRAFGIDQDHSPKLRKYTTTSRQRQRNETEEPL